MGIPGTMLRPGSISGASCSRIDRAQCPALTDVKTSVCSHPLEGLDVPHPYTGGECLYDAAGGKVMAGAADSFRREPQNTAKITEREVAGDREIPLTVPAMRGKAVQEKTGQLGGGT